MFKLKKRLKSGPYVGAVGFADGYHYPVKEDGHLDMSQSVLWYADHGGYFWAQPTDPTHAHLYEQRVVELPVQDLLVRDA